MKDRRPRKLKKLLKKRYRKAVALKTMQTALVTVGSAFQIAAIQSIPNFNKGSLIPPDLARQPMSPAERAIAVVNLTIDTEKWIAEIINSGPKNWREA